MYRCLSPDPSARPTATQLVELLQSAAGTPPTSTEVSAIGTGLAAAPPLSCGSVSGGSHPGDSGGAPQHAQQGQHAQHWGGPSSGRAPRPPALASVDEACNGELPAGCPASLGWQVRSNGTAVSVKSQQELEQELVEELVAESAPNSGALSGLSGGGGEAALQRRLVLPTTALASSSPFSAPSPFSPFQPAAP